MTHRLSQPWRGAATTLLILLLFGVITASAQEGPGREALASLSGDSPVSWSPRAGSGYDRVVLKVSGPDNFFEESEFPKGQTPSFVPPADGSYVYELYLVPVGGPQFGSGQPNAGFGQGSIVDNGRGIADSGFAPLNSKRGPVQSGVFTVLGGLRADPTAVEQ